MNLHQKIKEEIKTAMRAKDALRLETLRGLNALFQNEMLSSKATSSPQGEQYLPDDKSLPLVKRSVKQRKDSIEQFEKGGRQDLADKEKAELAILQAYLPQTMSREEIRPVVQKHLAAMRAAGPVDQKSAGKLVGIVMRELAGKAEGTDIKAEIDALLT